MSNKQADETNELFLTLWDKAVGTPGYDKAEWQRLQELLYDKFPPRPPQPPSGKKRN